MKIKLLILCNKDIYKGSDLLELFENVTGVEFFGDRVYVVVLGTCP